jgi:DNA invertase Pin-like site-specific DNA recombinase
VRCIVYARYSTDRQTEASIEDQLRVCREYAEARAWVVAGEHVDRGISGAALGNRPGVQEALAALRAGDVLLVNDLSRLSRSQDLAPLLARLRHRGTRVLGVQDGFDTEARSARMQAGLSGIMSEEFRAMVSDRTRSALEQRARSGQATGGKPFENVELVREIFDRFAGGESLLAIARDLNARGIPSPGASWKERSRPRGKWMVSALHSMLKNERYVGRVIWNRSQWVKDPDTGKRRRRENPREEWIVRECEPIVDQATWDRAQARFRHRTGRGGVPSYLLSGLLVCGVCGGKLIVAGGSGRRYVCGTRHHGGDAACNNASGIPRRIAEAYVLDGVERVLRSPEAQALALTEMRRIRAEAERAQPIEQDRELAELERMVREGILSPEIAAPSLDAARRRAAARRAAPAGDMPWPTAERWRQAVDSFCEVLRGEEVAAARELLRDEIGEVRCVPEGDAVVAEIGAQRVAMRTGNGIWVGSGGPLRIHIPTRIAGTPLSRRGRRPRT